MNFEIPNEINTVFETFLKNGYEAYLVGGCVRDYIMNKVPHDFDMATNALPEDTKRIFCDYKTIETGIKHGTVTVVVNSLHIEITTYRVDGEYKDNRRPDNVSFTKNIEEDLKRRDFSVNAMAYNPKNGLFDPFFGKKDIEKRKIVCVGEADKRFSEDGLRILRALRFSSTLGFEIDEKTKISIHKNKELLSNISKERIFEELKKLLLGENAENVLKEYNDVFKVIIPETSVNEKCAKLVSRVLKNEEIRFACLFFYEADFETKARNMLNFLKTSNEFKKNVLEMLKATQNEFYFDNKNIKRILKKHGLKSTRNALELLRGDEIDVSQILKEIENIEKNNECYSLKKLAIDGNDVLKMGYFGKDIKKVLDYALDLVIAGEKNEKNSLCDALLKKLAKNDNFSQNTIDNMKK